MNFRLFFTLAIFFFLFFSGQKKGLEDWGFYAHKKINRMAVLTLPPEMGVFFKKNIAFLSDHATDPDMRRYIDPHEAARHFIDLDMWGKSPFERLPRKWAEALIYSSEWFAVLDGRDTVRVFVDAVEETRGVRFDSILPIWETRCEQVVRINSLNIKQLRDFYYAQMLPNFYEEKWKIPTDSLQKWFDASGLGEFCVQQGFAIEHITEHGIVPWHLALMQHRLTDAFREKNGKKILRFAAEIGHYIGDAHVPLHTSSNYDGQKTGQSGLHAFWESRLPELFADREWDFFVGKPDYLTDPPAFFWETIFESHRLADSVFMVEKHLRNTFSPTLQMCMDERNGVMMLVQCREFAAAFQRGLGGMVERRMQQTIHDVSSAWFTAWVDAGEPDLSKLDEKSTVESDQISADSLQTLRQKNPILGRPEEN
jgi:hypothetical protein